MDIYIKISMFIYISIIICLPVSLSNDLADPVFDGVGLASFKSRVNDFIFPKLLA